MSRIASGRVLATTDIIGPVFECSTGRGLYFSAAGQLISKGLFWDLPFCFQVMVTVTAEVGNTCTLSYMYIKSRVGVTGEIDVPHSTFNCEIISSPDAGFSGGIIVLYLGKPVREYIILHTQIRLHTCIYNYRSDLPCRIPELLLDPWDDIANFKIVLNFLFLAIVNS